MAAHALVVPYPGRGHLNPMMRFALKLASHDISVTFVVTESWHKIITKSDENPFTTCTDASNFRAAVIPDCVVDESQRADNFMEFMLSLSNMETHVARLVSDLNCSGKPVTCIIADFFLKWAVPLAKKHNLLSVSLCPMSVTVFSIYYHLFAGLEEWKDYIARSAPLQSTDYLASLTSTTSNPVGDLIRECYANVRTTDWIVANSFYPLECRAVEAQTHKSPVLCVGPFDIASSSKLLQTHFTDWLDSKPERSVIYVSFGSFMTVARGQLREIADGLMKSGCYFLWALRPDREASDVSEMLAYGYLEECKGRGVIAPWFRQAEVLRHPAVGGFLSHCGWNAVMESVSAGVPMLGFPIGADQFINCRLVVEEWEFGLGLKNTEDEKYFNSRLMAEQRKLGFGVKKAEDGSRVIRGEEVELKLRMLMEGEEGVRVRREAEKFRDLAEEEVSKGGRSASNLGVLVSRLKGI